MRQSTRQSPGTPFHLPLPCPPPLFSRFPPSPPRYELECKYTQFIEVHSRPVMPRVDMAALVRTTPKSLCPNIL